MRRWVRARFLVPLVLLGGAAIGVPPLLAGESDSGTVACDHPSYADFNGDRITDVVRGRPNAAVDGVGAGAVEVWYGGANGTATISQNTAGVPGTAELGDGFGTVVSIGDVNRDQCSDLVVSAPSEDVGAARDAGAVWVIPGAPSGLDLAKAYSTSQNSVGIPGTAETGDNFGHSVAVVRGGIVVGSPREDLSVTDAGSIHVIADGSAAMLHQDSAGVPGHQEAGDRFGEVLSGDDGSFLVGVPHEAVGTAASAGTVHLFDWAPGTAAQPGPVFSQNQSDISGTPEAGDQFGASLGMARFVAGAESHLGFAIGAPGESLTSADANHGMVHTFVAGDGFGPSEAYAVHQNSYGVAGEAEPDDRFGALLSVTATPPDPEDDGDRHLLVTSVTGHEQDDIEQGQGPAIQVFEGSDNVGSTDRWIKPGSYGLAADTRLSGWYVDTYPDALLLADTDDRHLYAVPTGNIAFDDTEPVRRYGD